MYETGRTLTQPFPEEIAGRLPAGGHKDLLRPTARIGSETRRCCSGGNVLLRGFRSGCQLPSSDGPKLGEDRVSGHAVCKKVPEAPEPETCTAWPQPH